MLKELFLLFHKITKIKLPLSHKCPKRVSPLFSLIPKTPGLFSGGIYLFKSLLTSHLEKGFLFIDMV